MENQKFTIHGRISLILYMLSFGIGIYSIGSGSLLLGFLYMILIAFAFIVVAVIYCSKCRCRERCNHFFIGKLSVLLSIKNEDPYNGYDYVVGLAPMLLAIVFPQYWLINNLVLMASFWVFLILGGLEAYLLVCNKCANYKCKICRNKIISVRLDGSSNENH